MQSTNLLLTRMILSNWQLIPEFCQNQYNISTLRIHDHANTCNEPHENLSTTVHMRVSKRIQMVYICIFSVSRDSDGVGTRFMGYYSFTRTGRVEDIRNGFPFTIHGGVRRWARYVIPANYLLRYFYIQYIRERRMVGAPSNPIGHTGDPSWERRKPT